MISLVLTGTKGSDLQGFRYMWLKDVHGFNPLTHCAASLIGTYMKGVGSTMDANFPLALPHLAEGHAYYLCGVSAPYNWKNNFHLAFTDGHDTIEAPLWTGAKFVLTNVKRLDFDDSKALACYPDRNKTFLTCRNFQFGAHMFTKLMD